jgi:hypothetical protein
MLNLIQTRAGHFGGHFELMARVLLYRKILVKLGGQ